MSPPIVLCILDGWGVGEPSSDNAIALAKTPNWDRYLDTCPNSLLEASAIDVGLPAGQMGNSEVGHMNIGSGRIILQDLPRIDQAIVDRKLEDNTAFRRFAGLLQKTGGSCHLVGLVSPGGVHSHQNHVVAVARILASKSIDVQIHALLDGRDTPPKSALKYLKELEASIETDKNISIATVSGRYFAMDRDKRWDRVKLAYDTIMLGSGQKYESANAALQSSYQKKITDEFVLPTSISGFTGVQDGDGLIMANFRADRVRQLLGALVDPGFKEFSVKRRVEFSAKLGLTEYSENLSRFMDTMFPAGRVDGTLGEVISSAGLQQLRIAETEKYAHVTFFLNGGRESPYAGETRILVPSPKVATYDQKPEMSAPEITQQLLQAMDSRKFEFSVVNFANADMVGHTGCLSAAISAVEVVDECLGAVTQAAARQGGLVLITSDHGNAEKMADPSTKHSHTAHTTNKVPFIVVGNHKLSVSDGKLSDIAPTILNIMGLSVPQEMTGNILVHKHR